MCATDHDKKCFCFARAWLERTATCTGGSGGGGGGARDSNHHRLKGGCPTTDTNANCLRSAPQTAASTCSGYSSRSTTRRRHPSPGTPSPTRARGCCCLCGGRGGGGGGGGLDKSSFCFSSLSRCLVPGVARKLGSGATTGCCSKKDSSTNCSERRKDFAIHVLLLVVSALCFANTLVLPQQFVHDDIPAICSNPDVLGTGTLSDVFLNDFWGKPMAHPDSHKSYRPLTTLTFRLNMYLSGESGSNAFGGARQSRSLPRSTFGFKLVNLGLHALVVHLIAILVRYELNWSPRHTLMASLYFATHPIHTEAVASIVGRADVLCCVFFLLSFLSQCRALRAESFSKEMMLSLTISSLCATMALLSKETGITVLPLCIIYYFIKAPQRSSASIVFSTSKSLANGLGSRRFQGEEPKSEGAKPSNLLHLAWLYGPVVVPVITLLALLMFRINILNGTLPYFSEQDNPASFAESLTTRALTYTYLAAFNAMLLMAPTNLSYDWQLGSIPLVKSPLDPRNIFSLLLALAMGAFLCKCRPALSSALRSLGQRIVSRDQDEVLPLLRAKNGTRHYQSEEEEEEALESQRHLLLGLCFLVLPFIPASNLLVTVGFVVAERILYIPSIGMALIVMVGMRRLERVSLTNSSHHCQWTNIKNVCKLLFCGLVLCFALKTFQQNRVWQSRESLFESGLKAVPENAKAHYNFANLQKDGGKLQLAAHHYREALRLWPQHESSHNNLGTILTDSGEAEAHFKLALQINPFHPRAHFNLANIYSKKGLTWKAISLLKRSIELDSNFAEPYSALAAIYAEQGLKEEARSLHLLSNVQPTVSLCGAIVRVACP